MNDVFGTLGQYDLKIEQMFWGRMQQKLKAMDTFGKYSNITA